MIKYSASLTVHWPTGPIHSCETHADKAISIARVMGFHLAVTEAPDGAECVNCKREQE